MLTDIHFKLTPGRFFDELVINLRKNRLMGVGTTYVDMLSYKMKIKTQDVGKKPEFQL